MVLTLAASILASVQVVRPIWNSCGSCGALRLGKQQLNLSSFQCGHPAASYRERPCGSPDDVEDEWVVAHDTKLLRWNLDYSWFGQKDFSWLWRGGGEAAAAGQGRGAATAAGGRVGCF